VTDGEGERMGRYVCASLSSYGPECEKERVFKCVFESE